MLETKINNTVVRLEKGDITALKIESIVFYASPDLILGSGFGSAISARGGGSIQEELKEIGTIDTGQAVMTSAGELNSDYIIHAVGPRFQEEDLERKLEKTMISALNLAREKGIHKLAFPPMGSGFYGIPLDVCARIMLGAIREHVNKNSEFEEIIICVLDKRELKAFQDKWSDLN